MTAPNQGITAVVLTFSEELNPRSALRCSLYRLTAGVPRGRKLAFIKLLRIAGISYDADSRSVTLRLVPSRRTILVAVHRDLVSRTRFTTLVGYEGTIESNAKHLSRQAGWKRGGGDRDMGWASQYIASLSKGDAVQFRPRGHSMRGKVDSGQLCTVEPTDPAVLTVRDIVLCKVNGREYLHLIKAIQGGRFQIGNNRGRINGWISANSIFGKCVKVEK